MTVLLSTLIGGCLALIGGYVTRQWEARRARRADILVEVLLPALQLSRNTMIRAEAGDLVYPSELITLLPRLERLAMAASARDYRFAAKAAGLLPTLDERHKATQDSSRSRGVSGYHPQDVIRLFLPASQRMTDALGAYDEFLRQRLLGLRPVPRWLRPAVRFWRRRFSRSTGSSDTG